ncbi:MAG: glycosyltransferase [Chloroflexia bacterium]|nr:glycosyltransferase [Chloroflexia bacterium]
MTGSQPGRPRSLLMIAARAPVSGETKTRLGHAIGMDRAAVLYRAFLRDLADRFDSDAAAASRRYDLAWTYSPPDRDFASDLAEVTGRPAPVSTLYVPQDGPDWGTRQTNLLRWGADHGYARTVLMASDSPQLTSDIIDGAFAVLDSREIVLGRVRDGGYYLIGMRGFVDILSTVPMSTASAADGVVQSARALGFTIGETEPTFDIDEASDLNLLIEVLRDDPGLCPASRRALVDLNPAAFTP